MTLVGEEEECLLFRLSDAHTDIESLEGSSGAPILDSLGNVIAFVKGGRIEDDLIIGIPLAKYQGLLDLIISKIPTRETANWLDNIVEDKIKTPIWNDSKQEDS